eukprot:TRINITY_DN2147_c0_g2_i1.p1 TRINITY_DN2147_c0_g2~~TRINITY_DN2147_c0_g2_i1.p1  ORF type:complete len:744 (-),score=89.85 TRINITY_DN2147_c0_g2_i1:18-2198(-)
MRNLRSLHKALANLHKVAAEVSERVPKFPRDLVLPEIIAQELDRLFVGKQPHAIFNDPCRATTRTADALDPAHPLHQVTIIDRPFVTLRQPAIDLDVDAMVKQVRAVLNVNYRDGPRARNLLAIVRGVGTGKTRCLEELRAALLHDSDILPLLLTFNNWTPLEEAEKQPQAGWLGDPPRVAAVLCICRRILIAFYADLTLEEAPQLLNKLASALGPRINEVTLPALLAGVAIHCARRGNAKGLVLMLDETLRLSEFFRLDDPAAELRTALLDIVPASLQTALVMSALAISPLGISLSGRQVESLCVPNKLTAETVLQKWWQTDTLLGTPQKRQLRPVLLFLAEMSSDLPRGLERIGEGVAKIMQSENYRELLEQLIASVVEELRRIYRVTMPPPNVLLAALQNRTVDFLDTQQVNYPHFISSSSLTNAITLPAGRAVPRLNILLLLAASDDTSSFFADLASLMNDIASPQAMKDPGSILECFGRHWLAFRLRLFATAAGKCMRLSEILSIDVACFQKIDLPRPTLLSDWQVQLTVLSYDEPKQFLQLLAAVAVSTERPFGMITPHQKEAFDTGLLVWTNRQPHLFLFDYKSAWESGHQPTARKWKGLAQARYVSGLAQTTDEFPPQSAAAAMAAGRYSFVYLTANGNFTEAAADEVAATGKTDAIPPIILGRKHMESFLGFSSGIYQALRAIRQEALNTPTSNAAVPAKARKAEKALNPPTKRQKG